MIEKQPLRVAFIGIKTSQQRFILNELKKNFLVYRTKQETDVLFVKDDTKDYDIKYTLIFPYADLILNDLNFIISRVVKPNTDKFHKRNTHSINVNYTKESESTIEIPENTMLIDKINDLIKIRKNNVTDIIKQKHNLNIIFDEIYFLNAVDNYTGWNNMKKSCLDNNIFITRWESEIQNKNDILNLLNHIKTTNDDKILIIFDNNKFINDIKIPNNYDLNEILYVESSTALGGLIISKNNIDTIIQDIKHSSDLKISKYKKSSLFILE